MDRGISQVVLLVLVAGLLAIAMGALAIMARPSAVDERCRFRIFRLGGAVEAWLEDHGHRSYPAIANPVAGELWTPGRVGSASVLLWNYLGGNIPPQQRPTENKDQYFARLRNNELSVCPATGLEYWYNDAALARTSPAEVVDLRPPEIRYFQCQHPGPIAPHRQHRKQGYFTVYGTLANDTQTVTRHDLDAMRVQLKAREGETATAPASRSDDDDFLRRRIAEIENAMGPADSVQMKRFAVEVRFRPDPP
jgi:hypothetical protein